MKAKKEHNSAETDAASLRQSRFWRWLDKQLGLDVLHYEVPAHANSIFYTLGGITLAGVLILFVTGFYLAQFYNPQPAEARDSIIYLVTRVKFGEFVRSVHWWTANLVIITAVLHLVRVFATGSFKRPRELNWVIGIIMFTFLVALFFSGTVLKWDQEAYEALGHVEEVGKLMGKVGTFSTSNFTLSTSLLTRLSFVHTAILPAALMLVVAVHLLLVKKHQISPLPDRQERSNPRVYDTPTKPVSYFDLHLRKLIGYGMLLAALAALISLAIPATLGAPVVTGQEVTKPPWLFLGFYALEDWWGVKALLWASVVIPLGLLAVPFVDRSPFRHILNRKVFLIIGIAVALAWIALIIYGKVAPQKPHIEMGG